MMEFVIVSNTFDGCRSMLQPSHTLTRCTHIEICNTICQCRCLFLAVGLVRFTFVQKPIVFGNFSYSVSFFANVLQINTLFVLVVVVVLFLRFRNLSFFFIYKFHNNNKKKSATVTTIQWHLYSNNNKLYEVNKLKTEGGGKNDMKMILFMM